MPTLTGVETNNLKAIDVVFPHGQITAVVGGSGAGKTSLAFHTLYALCKNELDTISGIPASLQPVVRSYTHLLPAVALRQKHTNVNPRSSIFTYLGLDKLFLPLFMRANPAMRRNALAQNTPDNYCPTCQGLGIVYRPAPERIVDYNKPLAARPFLSWNHFASSHYYPLLEMFCAARGIDMSCSLAQLPEKQRDMLLNSPASEIFLVKYKQKKRYKPKRHYFIGAIREIREYCDNLQSPGVRQKAKAYLAEQLCPQCGGARFASPLQLFELQGWTIQNIMTASFTALLHFVSTLSGNNFAIHKLTELIQHVINNNLGYLTPMRSIPSLSGGEFQRLQLAAVLNADFCNLLYVIDEAASSLHVAEYDNVMKQIIALKQKSATVVMVEHKIEFIEQADTVIALDSGAITDSATWLQRQKEITLQRVKMLSNGKMNFSVHNIHNIKHLEITIPMGCLVGCCGVSGSGKSSFAESIAAQRDIVYISQGGIQGNSSSTVGTYLKLMQSLDVFLSKKLHKPLKTFLFNNAESQCPACAGKGYIVQEATFNHPYRHLCEQCQGQRYSAHVLAYTFKSYSIYELLTMTVAFLIGEGIFSESASITSKLSDMQAIGLGHLTLFRATSELSGGEAQRVKLLSQIKTNLKKTFLIVDEPSRGLERHDTMLLLKYFDSLVPFTKGIMIIEHNIFLLKQVDYMIEFGPGGGDAGGTVIYQGDIDTMANSASVLKNFI